MSNIDRILDEYRAADQGRRVAMWKGYVGLRPQFDAIDRDIEDEVVFGRGAWVYCRQHCRPHETGWCGVGVGDKVGLGVDTAEAAYTKCREWGFELGQPDSLTS